MIASNSNDVTTYNSQQSTAITNDSSSIIRTVVARYETQRQYTICTTDCLLLAALSQGTEYKNNRAPAALATLPEVLLGKKTLTELELYHPIHGEPEPEP